MPHALVRPWSRAVLPAALLAAVLVLAVGASGAGASITPGKYRIHTGATNWSHVVDAAGGAPRDGTPLVNWPSHGGSNQEWIVERLGTAITGAPFYHVRSVQDQRFCWDVAGASPFVGARVGLYGCHSGENQRFFISTDPVDAKRITAMHSGNQLGMTRGRGGHMRQAGSFTPDAETRFAFHRLP